MNVYDVLEQCLNEIEQGADVDTVLFRHPEYADELRPILEASVKAKSMAVQEPSAEVVRRNRAKVMQRAAEMRESKVKPASSRIWFASLRRVAVTLAVVLALFVSGTGLVRAASNTIPGDNLYPVKRTWEDVLLLFTFNSQEREQLEFDHENERLEELNELFTEGRSVNVDFAGYVTRQTGTEWRVSGIPVMISAQTVLPLEPVTVGDTVRVSGVTQPDGTVLAEQIAKLSPDIKLPSGNDNDAEIEQENSNESESPMEDNSNSGNENEAPDVRETQTLHAESEPQNEYFEGRLESIDSKNNVWVVSGKKLDVSTAEIKGTPMIGAPVKVEGYTGLNGIIIVTKIEILNSTNNNPSNSNDDENNDNEKDDDDNDNNNNGSEDD